MSDQGPGRKCIFNLKPAGSGEHLFPDWMNRTFPVDLEVEQPKLARHIANADGVATNSWTANEIASTTTNMVCHDCNTGWMSFLEGRAKPVLEPMMLGHEKSLDTSEQFLIATWAVKTAIVSRRL